VTRVALLCPGRGSYTEKTLGALPAEHAWVQRAEELRRAYPGPPLLELDRARRFESSLHLLPGHASPLIWLHSMLDAAAAAAEREIVCVGGNSLGWYTALAAAGALSFDEGFRLVQEMSLLQQELTSGGQILYPRIQEDWRADTDLERRVDDALASSKGEAFPSIELGGYAVLAGSEAGLAHLMRALPRVQRGSTPYPFRLLHHGPYHTTLASPVASRARETLASLEFKAPRIPLIDGRGARFSPWSTDVAALRDYTLGTQIVTPYDFSASVRVALREYAPAQLVLPGPGNTLGGVCGQILVSEHWRGIRSREDFERAQSSPEPPVVSMRR
jgi:[acyl-carrier-protein] S-malonyltransferase